MPNEATQFLSPLRYPGGKARLGPFVGSLIESQTVRPRTYVEPFAGGAGVGLRLLFDEYVDEIVLNDLNPGIAAFWRTLFADSGELAQRILSCPLTVDEWRQQKRIYTSGRATDGDLGFATFYLNRTNRSGILDARPIGGLDQRGKWKIGARFNRERLAERIRLLARYESRVTICEVDGVDLIRDHLDRSDSFIYADPPYLGQGDDLYLDTLTWGDHERLASMLRDGGRWLLTYDADERITSQLYPGMRCASFGISHTAASQHVGSEYAVFADSLQLGSLSELGRSGGQLL